MSETSSSPPRQQELTDALLRIVASRGIEQVTVREVGAEAGVSIGTVQHYFPTKDQMLVEAFHEVVRRIRRRTECIAYTSDIRRNLIAALGELLPLDRRRQDEVRIQIAFAARAMTAPDLAKVQRAILTELHDGIAAVFKNALGPDASDRDASSAAQIAMATADGLALHAVSSDGWLSAQRLRVVLGATVDALLPAGFADAEAIERGFREPH